MSLNLVQVVIAMTRNQTDSQPGLAVRSRATISQTAHNNLTRLCDGHDYNPAMDASATEIHHNGGYPSLMYRFGSELDDPASYSRSPPLRSTMHFTPAPQQEDDQMPENLLSKNMSEELVNSGLYDYFPETLGNEVFVNAMRELEMQQDEICELVTPNLALILTALDHMKSPTWPQNQANDFQSQSSEWHYVPSATQHDLPNTVQSMQSLPAKLIGAQTPRITTDVQGRQRPLLPNIVGLRPHALPDTSDSDDRTNARGRKRGLPPEARAAAQRVRIVGACGRCHVMKEKVCVSLLFCIC